MSEPGASMTDDGWGHRPMRRLLRLYLERRGYLTLAFLLVLMSAAATLFVPFILRRAVGSVILGDDDSLHRLVAVAICLAVVSLVLGYFSQLLVIHVSEWVAHRLRKLLVQRIQILPLPYLRERQTGYLMRRVEEVSTLGQDFLQNAFTFARHGLLVVFCIALLAFRELTSDSGDEGETQWAVFLIIPLVMGVGMFFHRRLKRFSKRRLEKWAAYDRTLKDVVTGIPTTRAFCAEDSEFRRVASASEDATRANIAMSRLGELSKIAIGALTFALPIIVLAYGGAQSMREELSFADFVTLLMFVGIFGTSLKAGFSSYTSLRRIAGHSDRLGELMRIEPDAHETLSEGAVPSSDAPVIEFHDVVMQYSGRPVLFEDVSFAISPGRKIGLVGPNGAGKSTVFNLILGLERPVDGRITVRGKRLDEVAPKELRRFISLIPQYPFMINGSIRDNLLLGRDDVSDDAIGEALRSVGLDQFIGSMAKGLDTEVGEDGRELSYGERKRLAVARCVLRGAELVLIDEATESLDEAHQGFIQDMLDEALADKTVVYISHRREELEHCDSIYAIKDGRLSSVALDDLSVEF